MSTPYDAGPQIAAQDTPAPLAIPDDDLGARAQAAGATAGDVDPGALLASITAMQSRLAALEAEKRQQTAAPVVATATALRDDLTEHASGKTLGYQDPDEHAPLLGLADDAVSAAEGAAESGDGGALGQIARRIDRALSRISLPGDHHYLSMARSHAADLVDQADELDAQAPAPAGAIAGSVVG